METDHEAALRVANKRHDIVAVTVTDPREETLPQVGLINVRDAESGTEVLVNTDDPAVRAAYAEEARRRATERDALFKRTRVDAIRIRTEQSYIEEVDRFFRMRGRRHA